MASTTLGVATERVSQLCKPLDHILHDTSPLSLLEYFIQYMESAEGLDLVQFWLSVESFKHATRRPASQSKQCEVSTCNTVPNTASVVSSLGSPTVNYSVSSQDQEHMCCDKNSTTGTFVSVSRKLEADGAVDLMEELEQHRNTVKNGSHLKQSTWPPGSYPVLAGSSGVGSGAPLCSAVVAAVDVVDSCPLDVASSQPHDRLYSVTGTPLPLVEQCGSQIDSDSNHSSRVDFCNGLQGSPSQPLSGVRGGRQSGSLSGDSKTSPSRLESGFSQQRSITIVTDAMGIYSTYIALNAVSPVGIPGELRQQVEASICPEDDSISRSCFDSSQSFVFSQMEKRYYPRFLRSSHFCKYQLEYISSGKLTLLDFLLGDNALFYFMEFMEQEDSFPLLQFWLTAESFCMHMSDPGKTPDMEVDTRDAIAIYERYFSLQATQPLGMGDSVRTAVENKICDELGPQANSYSVPQQIAYDGMNELYNQSFLKSSIYLRFLDELVHSVRNLRRDSIASGTCESSQGEESDAKEDNRFDVDSPELLWRRPHLPMRLGVVDAFGCYTSEIEPAPSKSGRIRHPVSGRKLWVKRVSDHEELAMKVAQKIVTEILESTANAAWQ